MEALDNASSMVLQVIISFYDRKPILTELGFDTSLAVWSYTEHGCPVLDPGLCGGI